MTCISGLILSTQNKKTKKESESEDPGQCLIWGECNMSQLYLLFILLFPTYYVNDINTNLYIFQYYYQQESIFQYSSITVGIIKEWVNITSFDFRKYNSIKSINQWANWKKRNDSQAH